MSTSYFLVKDAARGFRTLSAAGALALAIRLLWLSSGDGLSYVKERTQEAARTTKAADQTAPAEALNKDWDESSSRPDLEELKKLAGAELDEEDDKSASDDPLLRRILVDLGPARSEVFVQRNLVGRTPYVGQIACRLGDSLKVQVLPPSGLPIERKIVCRGDTLLVRE